MSAAAKTTVLLAAVMFLRMYGVFAALPVVAAFAAGLNAAPLWGGLAVGAHGLSQFLAQIPAGILADKFGRRKILALMLAIFSGGGLMCALAESGAALAAGRLLQGAGATGAVVVAWLADSLPDEKRAAGMAGFGAAIGAAFVAAILSAPPLAAMGFRAVFLVAAACGIAAMILLPFIPQPPAPRREQDGGGWRRDLMTRRAAALCWGMFCGHFALAAIFARLPLRLQDAGWAVEAHWKFYLPALFIALPLAAFIIKKKNLKPSPLLLLAGMLLLLPPPSLPSVAAGLAMFFAGFAAWEAMLPARMSREAPARRGAALGMLFSASFAGVFIGGLWGGAVENQAIALAGAGLVVLCWIPLSSGAVLKK